MEAKGGTELQYAELEKRLDPSYFKKFQITTSTTPFIIVGTKFKSIRRSSQY